MEGWFWPGGHRFDPSGLWSWHSAGVSVCKWKHRNQQIESEIMKIFSQKRKISMRRSSSLIFDVSFTQISATEWKQLSTCIHLNPWIISRATNCRTAWAQSTLSWGSDEVKWQQINQSVYNSCLFQPDTFPIIVSMGCSNFALLLHCRGSGKQVTLNYAKRKSEMFWHGLFQACFWVPLKIQT